MSQARLRTGILSVRAAVESVLAPQHAGGQRRRNRRHGSEWLKTSTIWHENFRQEQNHSRNSANSH